MNMKINIDSMDLYAFLGAVYFKGKWRFFYDQGSPLDWGINFKTVDPKMIPARRSSSQHFDVNNFDEYVSIFQTELFPTEIQNTIGKIPLSFIVNFDYQTFINSNSDEVLSLPMSDLLPFNWRYIETQNPYIYVPKDVKNLWFNKHVIAKPISSSEQIGIYPYTEIGAVKFSGSWRFFYEDHSVWLLNFDKIMEPNWLNDPIYGDWRKALPIVNEKTASDYLAMLKEHEITIGEIPRLAYILLEMQTPHIPQLKCVVDFDNTLFVDKAYSASQIKLNINPKEKFVPDHWTCHQDSPYKYIPEEFERLWKKD